MKPIKKYFWLILILLTGIFFRFYNLNWDKNQHLHPDERFLTMVAQGVSWPSGVTAYFDTPVSPLNPHNAGYPFYVYGTLPLFLVKLISQLFGMASYNGITLVGRFISAFLESLIILLVYIISAYILKNKKTALFSALVYSLSVLPIQLAHYFAVDTFLTFFLILSFYFLIRIIGSGMRSHQILFSAVLGLVYGLSLSSKISALLFLPILFVGFLYFIYKSRDFSRFILLGLTCAIFGFISLRIFQPYMFIGLFHINPEFVNNLKLLETYSDSGGWYPPSVQWIKTLPLIFPLENIIYWGLGPVLGLLSLISLILFFGHVRRYPLLFLVVMWVLGLFIYQGLQFAKPMRYFYPAYPFIALLAGLTLSRIWAMLKNRLIMVVLVLLLIYWPVSFLAVYSTANTRVQATDWIIKNIPQGSTLSCEYWDDCLPLGNNGAYRILELHLYDLESFQKWTDISNNLLKVDYIILSSNRLYGSIMTVPEKYPDTNVFYRDLFLGKLGFIPIVQFTSRPNLPLPGIRFCITPPFINYGKTAAGIQACDRSGISFVDDYADESFTVYDHPKVIIFKKI